MNIWLSEDFFTNIKIRRLERECGAESIKSIIKLWLYAAKYAVENLISDDKIGILKGCDDLDIEIISEWTLEDGRFFKSLISLKLLEERYGQYYIHDFMDNNPYISVLIKQKINGSKYANLRWQKKQQGDPMGDPMATEKKRKEKKVSTTKDIVEQKSQIRKKNSKKKESDEILIDDVIKKWNSLSGQDVHLTTESFRKQIRGRINELRKQKKENGSILEAFTHVFTNKKLHAEDDAYERFTEHDWNLTTLTRPKNFMKYLMEPEYTEPALGYDPKDYEGDCSGK